MPTLHNRSPRAPRHLRSAARVIESRGCYGAARIPRYMCYDRMSRSTPLTLRELDPAPCDSAVGSLFGAQREGGVMHKRWIVVAVTAGVAFGCTGLAMAATGS